MDERDLIYDWNAGEGTFDWSRVRVDLNDETLRDGLQSPSVRDPSLEVKQRLLHCMAGLGIAAADIGLPGAGPRVSSRCGRSPARSGTRSCPSRQTARRGR